MPKTTSKTCHHSLCAASFPMFHRQFNILHTVISRMAVQVSRPIWSVLFTAEPFFRCFYGLCPTKPQEQNGKEEIWQDNKTQFSRHPREGWQAKIPTTCEQSEKACDDEIGDKPDKQNAFKHISLSLDAMLCTPSASLPSTISSLRS